MGREGKGRGVKGRGRGMAGRGGIVKLSFIFSKNLGGAE